MIAMAMSCRPALLIADEPTTALDVTIQAQILDLISELQKQNNMSVLLITHDLGVVAERADEVAVMYASRIAEQATATSFSKGRCILIRRGFCGRCPQLGSERKPASGDTGHSAGPAAFPDGLQISPPLPDRKR